MLILGFCKYMVVGEYCNECTEGYYNFPECNRQCDCNIIGSQDIYCDGLSGQCNCFTGYSGRNCSTKCHPGFYGYDCEKGISWICMLWIH